MPHFDLFEKSIKILSNDELHHINYQIHPGFTPNQEEFIRNSLKIIANRLFNENILENMYRICGNSAQFLGPKVWSRSQLANNGNYHGSHDLLRFQLKCLGTSLFPVIHLYPFDEQTDTQAEGTVGCISCISHPTAFSIQGQFHIKLNRHHLDLSNNQTRQHVVYLAAVIVHEMLHNLGHKHKNNDDELWQINVFEQCFLTNGNYSL